MNVIYNYDLQDSSALDEPEYYCYYCYDQENMYQPSNTVTDKSYCPGNYEDYRDDIK
jgi:hypothetical protein